MPVNTAKPKRWTQVFQAGCEWQGWHFFFPHKAKDKKRIDFIYLCRLAITEHNTEAMHSDSSDTRAYFTILGR